MPSRVGAGSLSIDVEGVGTGLNDCDDDVECVVREYAMPGSESGDCCRPMWRLVTMGAFFVSAVGLVVTAGWVRGG